MNKSFLVLLMTPILVCAFAFLSCGNDDAGNNGDDDDNDNDDDDTPFELEIEWKPCSLAENENDGLAECGTAQVPLFWEDENDTRLIEVAVKRWLSDETSTGQLWLLQGGPGASGMMTFEPFMREIRNVAPEFDLYTIDHRGVGYSTHLSCPIQEAEASDGGAYITYEEFDACLAYLETEMDDGLQGFSTRNAAHDLAAFIDATRSPDQTVFVWGGSYGTYLVQRYLLLYPNQADGAIVDSINAVSEPGIQFSEFRNENGKLLLERCADDPFCAGKFATDPWTVLENLHEKLDNGHCPMLGIDRYTFSYLLGWLAWYSPINAAVPSLIYRLDRCSLDDMNAIVYLWEHPFNGSGDLLGLTEGWWSQILNANISLADQFWGPKFDGVDLEEYFSSLMETVLIGDITTMETWEMYSGWPKYDEPDSRTLPVTDIPVLMMQGELDGSTPLVSAEPLGDVLTGQHQTFVIFPNSAHGVASDSWLASDSEAPTCGLTMLAAFLRDPQEPVDASCVAATLPVNFAGDADLAQYLYGTDDLWENGVKNRHKVTGQPTAFRPIVY